jgi:hypothetical protein
MIFDPVSKPSDNAPFRTSMGRHVLRAQREVSTAVNATNPAANHKSADTRLLTRNSGVVKRAKVIQTDQARPD